MSLSPARPLCAAGLAVLLAALASPCLAMPPAASTAPSYDALLTRLDQMPSALEADALSAAAQARVEQAAARPNPSLDLEAENIHGTGPYAGFGNADLTAAIRQPLELFGQRHARIDAALSEATAAGLRGEFVRWQAAARLALSYAEAEAAQRRLALTEETLSLTEQDATAVAVLVQEGREAALRGLQAQAEQEAARAARDEARALRDAAFARLAAIAMLDTPIHRIDDSLLDRATVAVPAPETPPLAVRIAQAELDAASRHVVVERKRALPDLDASIGMRRFRGSGDDAFTVGLSVTVPLFDRNRGGIGAAQAQQRAAQARVLAERQQAQADRLAAQAALTASHSRIRAADSSVIAAEEAYRLARIGVEAGRISQLELRSVRSALILARNTTVDARLTRVLAEIDLARLDGRAPFGNLP